MTSMHIAIGLATSAAILATSAPLASADDAWLWLDDENTSTCDDPFLEDLATCQVTSTVAEDCDGGGNCNWWWSEGVIHLFPARLEADVSAYGAIDSVWVEYWDGPGGGRVVAYDDGAVAQEGETNGSGIPVILRTGGATIDLVAVSGCGMDLYEIGIYYSSGEVGVDVLRPAESGAVTLSPPAPNPSVDSQTLRWSAPAAGRVELRIVDVAGRNVRTLIAGESVAEGPGARTWDGRNDRGERVPAGVYFARLTVGEHRAVRRLVRNP